MTEQMKPASKKEAPDPSFNYDRSHPSREAGLGRMDVEKTTPRPEPDAIGQAVTQQQDGARQLNGEDVVANSREGNIGPSAPAPAQPDHSMKDEEPLGWDQAPTDIQNPRDQRHPRTDGQGGTK